MLGEGVLSPLSYPPLATEEHAEGLLDGLHPDEADVVAVGAQPVQICLGEDHRAEADALGLHDALLDTTHGAYLTR